MKLGKLARRSSNVCILTAALVIRNGAHANSDRHKSIVVECRAYAVGFRSTLKGSLISGGRIRSDAGRNRRRGASHVSRLHWPAYERIQPDPVLIPPPLPEGLQKPNRGRFAGSGLWSR